MKNPRYPKLYQTGWLREQYVTNDRTLDQIAKEVGCTKGAVWVAVQSLKLKKGRGLRKSAWLKLALKNGISENTFHYRVYTAKWTVEKAATLPTRGK